MFYYEFMQKAVSLAVEEADNGKYYLEPAFRVILNSEGLDPADIKDYEIDWGGVKEYLELYVKKMNTTSDKAPAVMDWIHQIITTTVEPAIFQEETDYIKQVTEFMKANHALNSGDFDGDDAVAKPE